MFYSFHIAYIPFVLLTMLSGNEVLKKSSIDTHQVETALSKEANQSFGDSITGHWKLTLEAYDENGNKVLDEAERKKGIKNRYSLRLNPDGSCRIQEVYKGRYEIKTNGNTKKLYVYRNRIAGEEEQDPPPDIYSIISASKNQIVLLENEGNLTFWVFERAD